MTESTTVPGRPVPPPPKRGNGNGTSTGPAKQFRFTKPSQQRMGRIITIYGPGGCGKTTLMATAPGPVRVFDFDRSLPQLQSQLGDLDVQAIDGVETYQDVRDALHSNIWDGVGSIGMDSGTRYEETVIEHVVKNVPHPQGKKVQRLADHGWNGPRMVQDEFIKLWADFEPHLRAGRNIIFVCHEEVTKAPNPEGQDWVRYEPRLLNDPKGNVRMWVKEQSSEVLYIGYDVNVAKGKGTGSGTRTIWPMERPHCLAKNRCGLNDPIELIQFDRTIWDLIFGTKAE